MCVLPTNFSDSTYLVVFDDGSVGVIKELVDTSKEDEGWDVPGVDLDHLFICVSSICQSSVREKWRERDKLSELGPVKGCKRIRTLLSCMQCPD